MTQYSKEEHDRLRRLWKKFWTYRFRLEDEYRQAHGMEDEEKFPYPYGLRLPPLPRELHGMRCGAKTRGGWPCKQRVLYVNGRCKFHGGLSTGPTSEAGKRKSAENGKKAARLATAEAGSTNKAR